MRLEFDWEGGKVDEQISKSIKSFQLIIKMLTISIIIIASILAIIILAFLLKSSLPQNKKQSILLLLGFLVFTSILISNIKSKQIFSFNLFSSHTANRINSAFYGQLPTYQTKYHLDEGLIGSTLANNNYGAIEAKSYEEKIIYISKKDEGASLFLYRLAQCLRSQGIPTFYIKIQSHFNSFNEVLRKTGIPSLQAFDAAIKAYCQSGKNPYILIDNIERLSISFWSVIEKLAQRKGVNMIFNTETRGALNEIIQVVEDENWLKEFQIQRWKGPNRQMLEKMSPNNSYLKKLSVDFKVISALSEGISEEEIALRSSNSYTNVANYFGCLDSLNKIKRRLEFGALSFSELKQLQIPYEKIESMERLGLIRIENGELKLK